MAAPFTKECFARLEPEERAHFMYLQTRPTYSYGSAYLPEDCSECTACGQPMLGHGGFCPACYADYRRYYDKAMGEA